MSLRLLYRICYGWARLVQSRTLLLFLAGAVATALFLYSRDSGLANSGFQHGRRIMHETLSQQRQMVGRENVYDVPADPAELQANDTKPFPWKPKKSDLVQCAKLLEGDEAEMQRALVVQKNLSESYHLLPDENVTILAKDCERLKEEKGFILHHLTEEERDFPIAFSMNVFKSSEQAIDLLAAIYRPQNVYCIHIDAKVNGSYREAILSVANCFPNVFVASRSVNVLWGTFSVLEPELVCMKDLWNYKRWKYLINLTGEEYPLRTNYELVKILQAYNGANDVEVTRKKINKGRFHKGGTTVPYNMTLMKGAVHIVVNRDFVDFVLHNQISLDLLEWCKKIRHADEAFFQMINHHPWLGIRGSYLGEPETNETTKPFLARYKNWGTFKCAGRKFVHGVCILTVGDLPIIHKRPEMFANKFYYNTGRLALDCLAERHYNRTRDEYLGKLQFDNSYYKALPFVKNMLIPK